MVPTLEANYLKLTSTVNHFLGKSKVKAIEPDFLSKVANDCKKNWPGSLLYLRAVSALSRKSHIYRIDEIVWHGWRIELFWVLWKKETLEAA